MLTNSIRKKVNIYFARCYKTIMKENTTTTKNALSCENKTLLFNDDNKCESRIVVKLIWINIFSMPKYLTLTCWIWLKTRKIYVSMCFFTRPKTSRKCYVSKCWPWNKFFLWNVCSRDFHEWKAKNSCQTEIQYQSYHIHIQFIHHFRWFFLSCYVYIYLYLAKSWITHLRCTMQEQVGGAERKKKNTPYSII